MRPPLDLVRRRARHFGVVVQRRNAQAYLAGLVGGYLVASHLRPGGLAFGAHQPVVALIGVFHVARALHPRNAARSWLLPLEGAWIFTGYLSAFHFWKLNIKTMPKPTARPLQ